MKDITKEAEPRAMIDKVPVYCVYDDIIDIAKAIPNPKNPNHHPQSQIDLLAKIIEAQGWRNPITISNRSGLIVKGHGRLLAALEIGQPQVPVEYQNYETEADEIADLTADNRLSELSEMETDTLTELLQDLQSDDFDIELAGYTDEDLDKLISELTTEDQDAPDGEEAQEEQPIARPGDIFQLGGHNLVCSSATSPEALENLKIVDAMVRMWEDTTGISAVLIGSSEVMIEASQEPQNEPMGGDN